MASLSVFTRIAHAAAVLFGRHGDITRTVHEHGCSRQTAYHHAAAVCQAVAQAQPPGPDREQLLRDHQQLRDENRRLWDEWDRALDGPADEQLRRFAAAAAALGLSLQQTRDLLAVVVPDRRLPSRPTLGRWVRQAGAAAGAVLAVTDAACQPLVTTGCLDEIFVRRQPILMAVEPHSLAWVLGRRAEDRSGPTWSQALAAWPALTDVAADGGSGIGLGLTLTARRRQEKASAPAAAPALPLHVQLDVFHLRRDGAQAVRAAWQEAERRWSEAEGLDRARQRYARTGKDRRHCNGGAAQKAWALAEAALAAAEQQEAAWRRVVAAVGVFRPDGRLNDRAAAAAELSAASAALPGERWAKVRRQLADPRALCFLDRLHEELSAVEPEAERREALLTLWHWRRARHEEAQGASEAVPWALVLGLLSGLWQARLGTGWEELLARVSGVLSRVVRASSAVECVNSVVRMHQARHRKLTQGLLDLKRLYWNCRPFVSGRRRGHCPYEHLGLALPTHDPWELLKLGSDQLKQQLSNARLAA